MQPTRTLLSMLCVAVVLGLALLKPVPSRAGDGTTPGGPVTPPATPQSTDPVAPQVPVVKKAKPARTTQLHLAFGRRVVGFARHFVGTRYVYGGSSPGSGFDCSGFVRFVYAHFGVSLPHSSYAQFDRGRRIARSSLRPGDLVFFDGLGHVGMYIGNGRFIHAPHTGTRVRIETLHGWYASRFSGARRIRSG